MMELKVRRVLGQCEESIGAESKGIDRVALYNWSVKINGRNKVGRGVLPRAPTTSALAVHLQGCHRLVLMN
jgi:hypothetical protein